LLNHPYLIGGTIIIIGGTIFLIYTGNMYEFFKKIKTGFDVVTEQMTNVGHALVIHKP